MKPLRALVAAAAVAALACSPSVETARKAEERGDHALACQSWLLVALSRGRTNERPEAGLSLRRPIHDWEHTVLRYVTPLRGDVPPPDPRFFEALEGARRCGCYDRSLITLRSFSADTLEREAFVAFWHALFFAPGAALPPAHRLHAQESWNDNLSTLTLRTERSYTYRGALVHHGSGVLTNLTLYPESETTVLVRPGEYSLILEAHVTFASGEQWTSPLNPLHLTAPPQPHALSTTLRTRVSRGPATGPH